MLKGATTKDLWNTINGGEGTEGPKGGGVGGVVRRE